MLTKIKFIFTILAVVAIAVFTHKSWFTTFSVIVGGDWGFYFKETMNEWFPVHSIWNPQLNFGYYDFFSTVFFVPIFLRSLLSVMNINFVFIDRILFLYPVALIAPFAMLYLCYKLTKNLVASFVASLFYSYNTYYLTLQTGHFAIALAYALFPIIFVVFDNFLKKPNYLRLLLLIFLTVFAFSNEARITILGCMIMVLYFIFDGAVNRRNYSFKKIRLLIKYIFVGGIIFLGLISYFVLPLVAFKDIGLSDVAGRGLFGVDYFPIQNALTLFHPFWSGVILTEFIPQPIPFYFWLFPAVVFAALFFAKSDKKIYFFASVALLGVFLGKGITPPFGNIYSFLYNHLVVFSLFREPSKFYFIIAFCYSVLLAFSLHYCFVFIEKRFAHKKIILIFKIAIISLLSGLIVYVSSPIINGTLADSFKAFSLPKEYQALKNFISSQIDFSRIMYFPNRQRFEFLSANHPSLSYIEISDALKSIDPEILKLYSVKYLVLPYDSTDDIYRHFGPRPIWQNMINKQQALKRIDYPSLGATSIYENTKGALPHIFIPEVTIYVAGDPSLLSSIIHLMPSATKAIYFSKPNIDDHKVISDDKFNAFNSYYFPFDCIRCKDMGKPWENYYFPYANILPDSPLYSFIQSKEQKDLNSLKSDQDAYLSKVAFYSLKRIVEIQKIISLQMNTEYIKQILVLHRELVSILQDNYIALENKHLENNDLLLRLTDSLTIERKVLGDYMYDGNLNGDIRNLLQNEYFLLDKGLTILNDKTLTSNGNTKKYILTLPQDITGELMLSMESVFSPFTVKVDNNQLSPLVDSGGWLSYGNETLSKGKHSLIVTFAKENSLVATSEATFVANASQETNKFSIPLAHFGGRNDITVSFMYQVKQGKPPRFFLTQNADRMTNGLLEVELDQFLKGDLGTWNKVVGRLKPKEGATNANLQFWIEGDPDQPTMLEIKDLSVKVDVSPIALFKNVVSKRISTFPKIIIKNVDPTHFQAQVINATKPYMLVFNEQYHSGWRASIDKENISEQNHIAMNGYANGWFIDKTGNYVVDIYFYSDKYYKIGILIFILTLFLVVVSILWTIKSKFKYEKKNY